MRTWGWMLVGAALWLLAGPVAGEPGERWRLAERRQRHGEPMAVFVEARKTPGRPAFKIETEFAASPQAAALALMAGMLQEDDLPRGHSRKILERSEREAVVFTSIDLPLMADREVALRITWLDVGADGVHRVEWKEANEVLPAGDGGAVRLSGTHGYWEFRPDAGRNRTRATYLTQAEIGGSFPTMLADRLMKAQAIDSVDRLRNRIDERRRADVAAGVPDSERIER